MSARVTAARSSAPSRTECSAVSSRSAFCSSCTCARARETGAGVQVGRDKGMAAGGTCRERGEDGEDSATHILLELQPARGRAGRRLRGEPPPRPVQRQRHAPGLTGFPAPPPPRRLGGSLLRDRNGERCEGSCRVRALGVEREEKARRERRRGGSRRLNGGEI